MGDCEPTGREVMAESIRRYECDCDRGERTPLNCWSCTGKRPKEWAIEAWHAGNSNETLHEFLGLSWKEYAAWVEG